MKLTIKTIMIVMLTTTFMSCKNEEKKPVENTSETTKFQIDANTISLKWTAFKTTDKLPVGGTFGKINVKESFSSDKIEKAIEKVSFSIPITSINSGNEGRDVKLVKNFFNTMDNTEIITGTFNLTEGNAEKGTGVLDLKMNGHDCDLPYEYTISNDSMFITTTLNLNEWDAQNSLDSLNVACNEKHKAADGISKTWTDVEIKASVAIVKK